MTALQPPVEFESAFRSINYELEQLANRQYRVKSFYIVSQSCVDVLRSLCDILSDVVDDEHRNIITQAKAMAETILLMGKHIAPREGVRSYLALLVSASQLLESLTSLVADLQQKIASLTEKNKKLEAILAQFLAVAKKAETEDIGNGEDEDYDSFMPSQKSDAGESDSEEATTKEDDATTTPPKAKKSRGK